jgi:hypothetical protein
MYYTRSNPVMDFRFFHVRIICHLNLRKISGSSVHDNITKLREASEVSLRLEARIDSIWVTQPKWPLYGKMTP